MSESGNVTGGGIDDKGVYKVEGSYSTNATGKYQVSFSKTYNNEDKVATYSGVYDNDKISGIYEHKLSNQDERFELVYTGLKIKPVQGAWQGNFSLSQLNQKNRFFYK